MELHSVVAQLLEWGNQRNVTNSLVHRHLQIQKSLNLIHCQGPCHHISALLKPTQKTSLKLALIKCPYKKSLLSQVRARLDPITYIKRLPDSML